MDAEPQGNLGEIGQRAPNCSIDTAHLGNEPMSLGTMLLVTQRNPEKIGRLQSENVLAMPEPRAFAV